MFTPLFIQLCDVVKVHFGKKLPVSWWWKKKTEILPKTKDSINFPKFRATLRSLYSSQVCAVKLIQLCVCVCVGMHAVFVCVCG